MNACIAYPPADDEYLDKNSVEFHSHMGYRLVGNFTNAAINSTAGTTWYGWKN